MFDVWQALTSMKEPGFKVSLAIHEEQQRERDTAARCQRVVIDLLALFTLQKINKLSLLAEMFDAVFVHQAALDELNETIQEETLHAESGRSYAATVRGRFVMKDVPAEVIKENVKLLEAVRDFVRKTSVLSGLQRELSDLDKEVIESLGYSASYTCILAAQMQLPLLTDDGLLRAPLRNTYRVESFSTHTLLAHAMERGKLTEEEFYEAVLLLLKLRYRYVPASAALLTHSTVKNGFESGDDFLTVLEELGRGEVSIPWLANIAGDFLKDLWLRSLVDTTKSLLLHAILATITEHHSPQAALRTLLAYLHSQMRLIPHYYIDIYGQTKRWAAVTYPEVSL
jgi:predicted nucleic acid-binding protein